MKRLELIESFIDKCGTLADIGCDHGFISEYVLKNNLAKTVYATDISEKSLSKARTNLAQFKNVEFYVSDGFNSLPSVPDTAVICGMGGYEIIKIIQNEKMKVPLLILGAQTDVRQLRQLLNSTGYKIKKDCLAFEFGKFYDIIKAELNHDNKTLEKYDECQLSYGVFYKEKNELLKSKIELTEKKLKSYKLTCENKKKLELLREVKKWQQ